MPNRPSNIRGTTFFQKADEFVEVTQLQYAVQTSNDRLKQLQDLELEYKSLTKLFHDTQNTLYKKEDDLKKIDKDYQKQKHISKKL